MEKKKDFWEFKDSGNYSEPEPKRYSDILAEQLKMAFLERERGLARRVDEATVTVPVSPNAASFTRYVVPGLGEYDTEDEALRAITKNVVAVANEEKRSVFLGEYAIYEINGNVRKVL